jgi:hypothetical protein
MRASRAYVGHAEGWDEPTIDGSIEARDCLLRYERRGPRTGGCLDLSRNFEAKLTMERHPA